MLPCLTTYDYDMIKLESTLLDVPYTQVSAHLAIWFLKRGYVKLIFIKIFLFENLPPPHFGQHPIPDDRNSINLNLRYLKMIPHMLQL